MKDEGRDSKEWQKNDILRIKDEAPESHVSGAPSFILNMSLFCDTLLSMSFLCHILLSLPVLLHSPFSTVYPFHAAWDTSTQILIPDFQTPKIIYHYYFISFKLHNCIVYCIVRCIVEATVIARWPFLTTHKLQLKLCICKRNLICIPRTFSTWGCSRAQSLLRHIEWCYSEM